MSGVRVDGVKPREVVLDVNQRELELRPETGRSPDQEYQAKYENLELNLFTSAWRNLGQASRDVASVFVNASNAMVGVPETTVGLVVGVVGNFDDVAWTAWHGLNTLGEKVDLMDEEFVKQLDKQGITGEKRAALEARWATFKTHAAGIIDSEEWGIFMDGAERITKGVGFTFIDGASAFKNVGDAVVEGGAGVVVGGTKGIGWLLGKGIGYTLEHLGAMLEWAGDKINRSGNYVEESTDRIYSNSPEARQIEAPTKY